MIRPRSLKRLLLILTATVLCGPIAWCYLPTVTRHPPEFVLRALPPTKDAPLRALRAERETIERYIANLYAGEIPERPDGYIGYCVLDVLDPYGAKVVVREGDCVVIRFSVTGLMADDAEPALIYSPRGLEGLPEGWRSTARQDRPKWPDDPRPYMFEFQQIDDHWFYCLWY